MNTAARIDDLTLGPRDLGALGLGAGDHYTRFVDEVRATLDQLLAES